MDLAEHSCYVAAKSSFARLFSMWSDGRGYLGTYLCVYYAVYAIIVHVCRLSEHPVLGGLK